MCIVCKIYNKSYMLFFEQKWQMKLQNIFANQDVVWIACVIQNIAICTMPVANNKKYK